MPIYEYACTDCGRSTEAWQRLSDSPLCECEACGGKLKKLISHNSFHLKGSGWYVTDYARKSGGCDKASDKASDKVSDKASDKASDKSDKPSAPKGAAEKTAE